MRTLISTVRGPLAVASLLLGAACGAVGADNQQAGTSDAAEEPGFFQTILQLDPDPVDVPAGTTVTLRLMNSLSSHETAAGSDFSAEVVQEVSIDGKVAVPVGSLIRGHVTEAHPANKIGGRAILSLAFDELVTPDGQTVRLAARLARSGKSEVARDAAIISGSTIGGAILGEALHEGEGTTVGAIAGAIGGTIGALKTKGKPVVLPQGTHLSITLDRPFSIEPAS